MSLVSIVVYRMQSVFEIQFSLEDVLQHDLNVFELMRLEVLFSNNLLDISLLLLQCQLESSVFLFEWLYNLMVVSQMLIDI